MHTYVHICKYLPCSCWDMQMWNQIKYKLGCIIHWAGQEQLSRWVLYGGCVCVWVCRCVRAAYYVNLLLCVYNSVTFGKLGMQSAKAASVYSAIFACVCVCKSVNVNCVIHNHTIFLMTRIAQLCVELNLKRPHFWCFIYLWTLPGFFLTNSEFEKKYTFVK